MACVFCGGPVDTPPQQLIQTIKHDGPEEAYIVCCVDEKHITSIGALQKRINKLMWCEVDLAGPGERIGGCLKAIDLVSKHRAWSRKFPS